jgi:phenylalanyl-tRNA synthetase beta chain
MIGLEVEGMTEVESVKGGLKGIVVGHVEECGRHPNADKLSLTKVNVGGEETLQIVCGAPNVAAGQKVLVATTGTTLYSAEGEPWKIKKGKIRGELSEGMICAEDELGLGTDHSGIMVLKEDAEVGKAAKDYFGLKSDIVFEIGLTPNRSDATSHLGVANDLAAYLKINHDYDNGVKLPDVSGFKVDMHTRKVKVEVENSKACPRYSGVTLTDIQVGDSPDWLKNYLQAIDVRPINNIVDITNFILHEIGQPLHAFDIEHISEDKIIVKTCPEDTSFTTLDEKERKLSSEDLMICDGTGSGLCIAGVFGGLGSGVTTETKTIFLESAHFDAGWIRKTSTRHLLRTDAAKVFEKGSDPNKTVYALKRAALLIKELAGGTICSDIVDIYPKEIKRPEIHIRYAHVNRLIGIDISKDEVHQILRAMDMEIEPLDSEGIIVHVPTDKSDVLREVDVIEEILRIYGFNKVGIEEGLTSKVFFKDVKDKHKIRHRLSDLLAAQGLSEMMGMSLIESKLIEETGVVDTSNFVYINNTSNIHLNIMRPEMMVSGLQSILHNHNRQNLDLKLFEFGRSYQEQDQKFKEQEYLTLFLSGDRRTESWRNVGRGAVDFYSIKMLVHGLLSKIGLTGYQISELDDNRFDFGLLYHRGPKEIVKFGKISDHIHKTMGLKTEVYYAEINLEVIYAHKKKATRIQEVSKFPMVRRDLALVVDKSIKFEQLEKIARQTDKKYLHMVNLFDIYENEDHLGKGKKSYAISYVFADDTKTLKDKEVDKIMNQMIQKYENQVQAMIRK